jgi:peptidoglycan/xylan/chitin deacetylase (PgdA/CDA1 family)
MVLKEINPIISIDNNYDKYIIRGNKSNKAISLVFKVTDNSPNKIISILNNNKIKGTFFVDGTFIEKNVNLLKRENQVFELLSYQNQYQESLFQSSISYLESLTNHKSNFCYTEEDNRELLILCKKLKLHTIKPTIIIKKDIYRNVKEYLDNAIIISLDINPLVEKELNKTINYIKEKGYQIVPLENLISESST